MFRHQTIIFPVSAIPLKASFQRSHSCHDSLLDICHNKKVLTLEFSFDFLSLELGFINKKIDWENFCRLRQHELLADDIEATQKHCTQGQVNSSCSHSQLQEYHKSCWLVAATNHSTFLARRSLIHLLMRPVFVWICTYKMASYGLGSLPMLLHLLFSNTNIWIDQLRFPVWQTQRFSERQKISRLCATQIFWWKMFVLLQSCFIQFPFTCSCGSKGNFCFLYSLRHPPTAIF